MNVLRKAGDLCSRVPATIWAVPLTALIGFSGSEMQKWRDASSYPEISKERIKALEGTWEGYGIQQIQDRESSLRLKARDIRIGNTTDPEFNSLMKIYNDCTFKAANTHASDAMWYPAHLTLRVGRTSFFSRKTLQGELILTPVLAKNSHTSLTYTVSGRLEQHGDYIRLDYAIADPSKKDFGTLLLENNGDGKLCGQFLSYGPISRSIVSGRYIFTEKAR